MPKHTEPTMQDEGRARPMDLDAIDAKVATLVMGWELVDRVAAGWGKGPPVYSTKDDANPTFQDFRPTREIDHAWRVVCRLRQLKFAVRIEANRFPSNDLVRVWANDDNEKYGDRAGGNSGNEIEPATAPLHICLAALAAVGKEGK
jgi:hypothetical protein